jgi:hypothetical protein
MSFKLEGGPAGFVSWNPPLLQSDQMKAKEVITIR